MTGKLVERTQEAQSCFRDEWTVTSKFQLQPKTLAATWTSPFRSNQCDILRSMGCVKSKRSDSLAQNANSTDKFESKSKKSKGEKAYLVHSEIGSPESSPQVNPVLLEYAHRLSEEIVARAVQQWVEIDRRYSDIPYIECDVPWYGKWGWWRGKGWERVEMALVLTPEIQRVIQQGLQSGGSWEYLPAESWNMNELSLTQWWPTLGLDYTWIEPYEPSSSAAKALWSGSWFGDYLHQSWNHAWSKVSSIRYHLSQTLFVPSPRWCQLFCEKSNVPCCQWKSILSSDAAAQPRFTPLTAEVINRSLQNPPSFHQDRNTPSCLAPSGLTNGLKFSLNGLPWDAAAELQ